MNKILLIALIVIVLPIIAVGCVACNTLGWFTGTAIKTAKQEFNAGELLRKYEWFKDTAAQLDKKKADIEVYNTRLSSMKADYEGTARKDWDRTDKEQMSLWQSELAGVKASFNGLAAEYNAQMAKFNWRFCNAGTLPEGASEPLPREFATYIGS